MASLNMLYVLPTPGAYPRKSLKIPRGLSGETSCSHSSGVFVITDSFLDLCCAAIVFATRELSRPSYNAGVKTGVRKNVQTQTVRFASVIAAIAVITAVDFKLHVNHTTVALMFLVTVLLTSAYW